MPETKLKLTASQFMEDVEIFAQKLFPANYLSIFNVQNKKIAEHIAALINSKPLQAELAGSDKDGNANK